MRRCEKGTLAGLQVNSMVKVTSISLGLHEQTYCHRRLMHLIHCGCRPRSMIGIREDIHGPRTPQFVVAEAHNILKVTKYKVLDSSHIGDCLLLLIM